MRKNAPNYISNNSRKEKKTYALTSRPFWSTQNNVVRIKPMIDMSTRRLLKTTVGSVMMTHNNYPLPNIYGPVYCL